MRTNYLEELSHVELVAINGGYGDPSSPAGKFGAWCRKMWKAFVDDIKESIQTFQEGWDSVEDWNA